MISSAHDIVAISQWLTTFKAFVLKHKLTWLVYTNRVTDFSYAQMNALSIGWNGFTSIFDYLNWCYRVLVENNVGTNVTIIKHLCKSLHKNLSKPCLYIFSIRDKQL
ncbi:NOF-FB transposable element protein [Aphis craccivora]|uniref:NOF-FB transposable element protein n=1 Tax=Aphis craccivora TaxID=307492 RepID=A0A6G0Z2H7_APHCR|nr:NOF-FB transposable element protein [Aphis craccivora]